MTTTPAPFIFDKDYRNLNQVAHLWDTYESRHQELVAAGRYPYNADFKGKIAGLVADDKNEDTAIYLLQTMRHIREFDAEVQALKDAGYAEPDVKPRGVTETKYTSVAFIRRNYYGGRSGTVTILSSARVIAREGVVDSVLPKGARTRGYVVGGFVRNDVLVKR